MTPFDGAALLAILLTFYPVVSVAELERARRERPEYFAGGTLGGSKGEKLTLPDGRCFDLIWALGDPFAVHRWQVVECGAGAGAGDPRFPLAPGPLAPIDLASWPRRTRADVFGPLVAGALAELGGSLEGLALAHGTIVERSSPARLETALAGPLEAVAGGLGGSAARLGAVAPGELVDATASLAHTIEAEDRDYDERIDVHFPDPGDPGGAPGDFPPGPDVPMPIGPGGGGGAIVIGELPGSGGGHA